MIQPRVAASPPPHLLDMLPSIGPGTSASRRPARHEIRPASEPAPKGLSLSLSISLSLPFCLSVSAYLSLSLYVSLSPSAACAPETLGRCHDGTPMAPRTARASHRETLHSVPSRLEVPISRHTKSMSLKYEPASEPLFISVK